MQLPSVKLRRATKNTHGQSIYSLIYFRITKVRGRNLQEYLRPDLPNDTSSDKTKRIDFFFNIEHRRVTQIKIVPNPGMMHMTYVLAYMNQNRLWNYIVYTFYWIRVCIWRIRYMHAKFHIKAHFNLHFYQCFNCYIIPSVIEMYKTLSINI